MVAIHAEALHPDRWDDDFPQPEQPRRLLVAEPRPLPDRSTRIRRRRLGALLVAALLVVACAALVDVVVGGGTGREPVPESVPKPGPGPITDDVYVVQPGDTLWSIAERLAPDEDPRPIVDELRRLTGGVALDVGDRVEVGDI